jgi:anti-sigma B factor antagonist
MSSERAAAERKLADNDFQIERWQDPGGYLRLTLSGELDLSSVSKLTTALSRLKRETEHVRLDLSQLQFLDSTGINALVVALRDARGDGWRLEVDRHVSPQVERVIGVSGVGPFLWPSNGG